MEHYLSCFSFNRRLLRPSGRRPWLSAPGPFLLWDTSDQTRDAVRFWLCFKKILHNADSRSKTFTSLCWNNDLAERTDGLTDLFLWRPKSEISTPCRQIFEIRSRSVGRQIHAPYILSPTALMLWSLVNTSRGEESEFPNVFCSSGNRDAYSLHIIQCARKSGFFRHALIFKEDIRRRYISLCFWKHKKVSESTLVWTW